MFIKIAVMYGDWKWRFKKFLIYFINDNTKRERITMTKNFFDFWECELKSKAVNKKQNMTLVCKYW